MCSSTCFRHSLLYQNGARAWAWLLELIPLGSEAHEFDLYLQGVMAVE
jgi:hypothetical protein